MRYLITFFFLLPFALIGQDTLMIKKSPNELILSSEFIKIDDLGKVSVDYSKAKKLDKNESVESVFLSTDSIIDNLTLRSSQAQDFSIGGQVMPVIPPSPTSMNLIEKVNAGINMYNGKLDAGVDIHTLSSNDLSLPVLLNYDGGGVRVDDYASEVGQSWNLSAGGVITRVIHSLPDEENSIYFTGESSNNNALSIKTLGYLNLQSPPQGEDLPVDLFPINFSDFDSQTTEYRQRVIAYSNWNSLSARRGSTNLPADVDHFPVGIDSKPDEFYFNFPGYSGKFVFNQDGSIHQIPDQNLKISKTVVSTLDSGPSIVKFEVTTPEGIIYTFGDANQNGVEESKLTTTTLTNNYTFRYFGSFPEQIGNAEVWMDGFFPFPDLNVTTNQQGQFVKDNFKKDGNSQLSVLNFYTSSWKLTKVESGKTNATIQLKYSEEEDVHYTINKNYSVDVPNFGVTFKDILYNRIENCNNPPGFQFSESLPVFYTIAANDICPNSVENRYQAGNALSHFSYSVSEITLKSQRLDEISTSSGELLTFGKGAERVDLPNSYRINNILLKYDGIRVKEWKLEYDDYNNEPEPAFLTCGDGAFPLLSTEKAYHINFPFDASESCTSNYMFEYSSFLDRKFILEQISNPTFDPDEFLDRQSKSYSAEHNRFFLNRVIEVGDNGDELDVAFFKYKAPESLPKRFSTMQDVGGYYNNNNDVGTKIQSFVYNDILGNQVLGFQNLNTHLWIGWDEVTAADYSYKGHFETPDLDRTQRGTLESILYRTGLMKTFSYELNTWGSSGIGRGLRISSINTSGSGVNQSKSYIYSGGVLMNSEIRRYQDDFLNYDLFTQIVSNASESFNPIINTRSGRVGYRQVEEFSSNLGSAKYFFTTPSTTENEDPENPDHFPNLFPNVYNIFSNVATLITSPSYAKPFPNLTDFSWRHGLIKKIEYKNGEGQLVMNVENTYNYDTPFTESEIFGLSSSIAVRPFPSPFKNYRGGTYKYISERFHLASSRTIVYYPDQNSTTSETIYQYNGNNDITNQSTNFSNGQSAEVRYRYPADFNNAASQEMVTRHIVAMPIETQVIQDGALVGGEKTIYDLDGNNIVPKNFLEAKAGAFRVQGRAVDWNSDGKITSYRKAKAGLTNPNTSGNHYFPAVSYSWENDLLKSIIYQNATIANYDYNDKRLLESTTDQNGVTNLYSYDGFNRLSNTISNNNRVNQEYTYNYQPFTVSSDITYTDGSTPQTELITMDGLGRSISVEQSGRLISGTSYDGAGRTVGIFEIGSGSSQYAYEQSVIGRLLFEIDGAGNKISYDYGVGGDLGQNPFDYVSTTDANDHTTKSIYDAFGFQEGIIDAIGGKTVNGYDGFNRLTTVAPPSGGNYTFTYTPDNLLKTKIVPGEGITRYLYDDRYRLVLTQDPAGTKIATTFDNFDRPLISGTFDGSLTDDNYVPENTVFPDEELSTTEYTGFYVTGGSEKIINANGSIGGTLEYSITPDDLGRPLFIEQGTVVGINRTVNTYDDAGLLRTQNIIHGGIEELELRYEFTPDEFLRPKDTRLIFNNKNILLSRLSYSSQDLVTNRALHANESEDAFLQNVSYTYDGGGRMVKVNDLTEQQEGGCFTGELCNYEVRLGIRPSDVLNITNIGTQSGEQPLDINYPFAIKEATPGVIDDDGLILAINEWIFEEGYLGEASLVINEYREDEGYDLSLFLLNTNLLLERVLFNRNGQFFFDRIFERGDCCEVTEEPVDPPGTPGASNSALFSELITYTGHDITKIGWQATCESGFNTYDFTYDPLHRLKNAKHRVRLLNSTTGLVETHIGRYNMEANYDAIGNITSLLRFGMTSTGGGTANFGIIDKLLYQVDGNQVKHIREFANAPNKGYPDSGEINYDQAGRMTDNEGRGIHIDYNLLNLPRQISYPDGVVENNYTSSGTKVSKVAPNSDDEEVFKQYAGEFEYVNGELESIFHSDGRLVKNDDDEWEYEYVIRDHLGSTRIVFVDENEDGQIADNEVRHENHFYPYGLNMEGNWTLPDPMGPVFKDFDYQYTGKELNRGAGMIDYGARWYDPAIGRWNAVDPLAEDFASWSPYNYVLGNPISLVDPDGRAPDNIVVPDKKDQKRILTMINEKASSSFEFNEQNELQLCESSCNVEFGSNYYTEKLIEGINAKETITIEIGQTFSANGKTKDVDKDAGGGVTISKAQGVKKEAVDQLVIISGNENVNLKDTKGNPLTDTAADILLHELVGHAIPHIVGSDTGNAVENENKARAEMTQYQSGVKVPSPLRAAEKRHKE